MRSLREVVIDLMETLLMQAVMDGNDAEATRIEDLLQELYDGDV